MSIKRMLAGRHNVCTSVHVYVRQCPVGCVRATSAFCNIGLFNAIISDSAMFQRFRAPVHQSGSCFDLHAPLLTVWIHARACRDTHTTSARQNMHQSVYFYTEMHICEVLMTVGLCRGKCVCGVCKNCTGFLCARISISAIWHETVRN